MNAAQRRAHAVLWPILGPAILLALAAAIYLRPGPVVQASPPVPAAAERPGEHRR